MWLCLKGGAKNDRQDNTNCCNFRADFVNFGKHILTAKNALAEYFQKRG